MSNILDILGNTEENKKEEVAILRPSPFYISMSIIKYLTNSGHEFKDYCPRELYERLRGVIPNNKNSFQKGKLLETLVLGGSAKGDSVKTLGVNKKTGGMLRDETDIRLFANLTKIKMQSHQIAVYDNINTQVPVICKVPNYDDVYLRTELDLCPTVINPNPDNASSGLKLAAIDLKGTPNIDKGFGAYDWSKYEFMDHCQPDSIFYLLDKLNLELCKKHNPEFEKKVGYDNLFTPFVMEHLGNIKFYYLVVGYKMDLDLKNIRLFERLKSGINESKTFRQREFEQRMLKCIARIEWHYENNFDPIPYHNNYEHTGCKYCPVNKYNNVMSNPDNWNGNLGYCTEANNIQAV